MVETFLIFGRGHAFLGEICTQGGAMERAMLTAEGERRLGAYVADWQARGVPVLREASRTKSGAVAFYQERIQVRKSDFVEALREWLEKHGIAMVGVAADQLECWEKILRLPLEPQERFSMIVTLRGTDKQAVARWRQALREAEEVVEKRECDLFAAIRSLKEKAARDLVMAFKKKTVLKT